MLSTDPHESHKPFIALQLGRIIKNELVTQVIVGDGWIVGCFLVFWKNHPAILGKRGIITAGIFF